MCDCKGLDCNKNATECSEHEVFRLGTEVQCQGDNKCRFDVNWHEGCGEECELPENVFCRGSMFSEVDHYFMNQTTNYTTQAQNARIVGGHSVNSDV